MKKAETATSVERERERERATTLINNEQAKLLALLRIFKADSKCKRHLESVFCRSYIN